MTTAVTIDHIMLIWQWCSDAYVRRGRRLAFPKNTDPTKTYQWRYLEALDRKLTEWNLDEAASKRFINAAASYASDRKLMAKGLSIFFQNNILQICYDRMQKEDNRINAAMLALESARDWLIAQAQGRPLTDVLLARCGFGTYPNIVKWQRAGHLNDVYLTLSKSCMTALARLAKSNQSDRALLPPATKLFLVRSTFLRDAAVRRTAQEIMQGDWRQ